MPEYEGDPVDKWCGCQVYGGWKVCDSAEANGPRPSNEVCVARVRYLFLAHSDVLFQLSTTCDRRKVQNNSFTQLVCICQ